MEYSSWPAVSTSRRQYSCPRTLSVLVKAGGSEKRALEAIAVERRPIFDDSNATRSAFEAFVYVCRLTVLDGGVVGVDELALHELDRERRLACEEKRGEW